LALRNADGTPVLKQYLVPAEDPADPAVLEYCVQPISYERVPGVSSSVNAVDGRTVWVLPLQGELLDDDPSTWPAEELEVCDPLPQYAMFVKEAELERLNMARTSEDVLARKQADVEEKLRLGDVIALEAAARIAVDGEMLDAAPEYAGIYHSLMWTGTIPGLQYHDETRSAPPAEIGPAQYVDGRLNSRFDAWELAAAAIGTAASKTMPLSIDAVLYYNQVIEFPPTDFTAPEGWNIDFVTTADGKKLVDYADFRYSRSETFPGSATILNVPEMRWEVRPYIGLVPFQNLSGTQNPDTDTLAGVVAFAQLADDVRALINYYHEIEGIPGLYMDPVGIDTHTDQLKRISEPAVDLGAMPQAVFPTEPFEVTASLFNPWGGETIESANLVVTIDAGDLALEQGDVTAISRPTNADPNSWELPFTASEGDLVGVWGPAGGFTVEPGDKYVTTFDVTLAGDAPATDYTVTLELAGDPVEESPEAGITTLATDTDTLRVYADTPTVLWGAVIPKLLTQAAQLQLPVRVYAPAAGGGTLRLTISGPPDDGDATTRELLQSGDVRVFGEQVATVPEAPEGEATIAEGEAVEPTTDMVRVQLQAVEGANQLVGTWPLDLDDGYTDVLWYVSVVEGAPLGQYAFDVALDGAQSVAPYTQVTTVVPADEHGKIPVDPGNGDGEEPTTPTDPGTGNGGGTVTPPPGEGGGDDIAGVERTGGKDRVDTAVMLSGKRFGAGAAEAAVIARADDYADALAAVPLADQADAPLLLSPEAVDARVVAEVDRAVEVDGTVYLVGGTDAVSEAVAAAMRGTGRTVVRLAGSNRYETAVAVADELGDPAAIMLATGTNYPDALAGGTAAAAVDGVLLLTRGAQLPEVTARYLAEHAAAQTYALGGPAAAAAPETTKVVGENRYGTAAKIATRFFDQPTGVGVASGTVFADALSGGADAAAQDWPMLLTHPKRLAAETADYVRRTASVTKAHLYGGEAAVHGDVATALGGHLHR